MNNIKLVIFDFDGVLADSARDIAGAIQATQKQYNHRIMEEDEIIKYVGFGAKYLVDNTLKGSGKQELEWYKKYYEEHAAVYTTLYPGVKEFLLHVNAKQGKMCVVSNKPEILVKKILQILGVYDYFDTVYGPESLTKMKPDPEGLIMCMKKNNTDASQTIMVGDSYSDILAGKACNTHTCGVLYGIGDPEKLKNVNADIYVNSLIEILNHYTF